MPFPIRQVTSPSTQKSPANVDREAADLRCVRSLREIPKSRFATRACLTAIQPRRPRPFIFSHIEVYKMVESIATELREAGVRPQTICAFILPNSVEAIVYFLALQWIGAIAVPIGPSIDGAILTTVLNEVSALTVVTPFVDEDERVDDQQYQMVHEVCLEFDIVHWMIARSTNKGVYLDMCGRRASEHPAWAGGAADFKFDPADTSYFLPSPHNMHQLMVPTSHGRAAEAISEFASCYDLTEQLSSLLILPLHNIHGLMSALVSMSSGGNTVITDTNTLDSEAIIKHVSSLHINWFVSDPNTLISLVDKMLSGNQSSAKSLEAISFIRCVDGTLGGGTLEKLQQIIGAPVLQSYGTIETCGFVSTNKREDKELGTCGKPIGAVEVVIFDSDFKSLAATSAEGWVAVRGGHVQVSNDTDSSVENEALVEHGGLTYFLTGDEGFVNEEGYLTITNLRSSSSASLGEQLQERIEERERELARKLEKAEQQRERMEIEAREMQQEAEREAERLREAEAILTAENDAQKSLSEESVTENEEQSSSTSTSEESDGSEEVKEASGEDVGSSMAEAFSTSEKVESEAQHTTEEFRVNMSDDDWIRSDLDNEESTSVATSLGGSTTDAKTSGRSRSQFTRESETTGLSKATTRSKTTNTGTKHGESESSLAVSVRHGISTTDGSSTSSVEESTHHTADTAGESVLESSGSSVAISTTSSFVKDSDGTSQLSTSVTEDRTSAATSRLNEKDLQLLQTIMDRLETIEENQKRLEEDIEKAHRSEMDKLRDLIEQVHVSRQAEVESAAASAAVAAAAATAPAKPDVEIEGLKKAVESAVASAESSSRDTAAAAKAAKEAATAAKAAATAHMDFIKKGSEKESMNENAVEKKMLISLEEVEEAIRVHPSIQKARAFGRPDMRFGAEVFCVVSLKVGARVSEAWLKLHAQSVLPAPYVPKVFFYKEDLEEDEDREKLASDSSMKRVSDVSGFSSKKMIKSPAWSPQAIS